MLNYDRKLDKPIIRIEVSDKGMLLRKILICVSRRNKESAIVVSSVR